MQQSQKTFANSSKVQVTNPGGKSYSEIKEARERACFLCESCPLQPRTAVLPLVPVTTQRLERCRGVPHPSCPGSAAPLPRAGVLCSSSTGPRWVLWAAEERRGLSAAGSHSSSHPRSVTQGVYPETTGFGSKTTACICV